jgi:hypothetical protein
VSIAADRSSAADELGMLAGAAVSLVPIGDDEEPSSITTPIRITPKGRP